MLDCHCHLDRFPNPELVAARAAGRDVFVVAMTNLPSHFVIGAPRVRALKRVRLSLGLHPLAAADHAREMATFERCLPETTFVGEVGLDFSRHGKSTAERQLATFRHVARLVADGGKVLSLHSRGAEAAVLDILAEHRIRAAAFHWYTGSLSTLERILSAGHYLSVNPAMTASVKGREIVRRVPKERLLTETDGPHVLVDRSPAMPWDVKLVEDAVAEEWSCSPEDVSRQVWANFAALVKLSTGELRP